MFGTLEQRINSLEDTIEQMSNEFIEFGDRIVAKSEPMAKMVSEPVLKSQSKPMNLGLNSPFDPFDFDALFAAATPSLTSHAVRQADPEICSQNYFQYPGNFNPRLNYRFFGTGNSFPQPTPTLETPWLTYVISGPSSFALRRHHRPPLQRSSRGTVTPRLRTDDLALPGSA